MQSSRELSYHIVDLLRQNITAMNTRNPKTRLWDEGDGGSGWLHNEILLAFELLEKINKGVAYPNWGNVYIVEEFRQKMEDMLTISDLKFIIFFLEMGGTGEVSFLDLRNESRKILLEWCYDKGGFRKTCAGCNAHIEKMKKCGGCAREHYCSEECQKRQWNSHKEVCKL